MNEILESLKSNNLAYRCVQLTGCQYKLDISVVCTGSGVTTLINIPFMHKLEKIEIKHLDSSKDDSFDSLDYSISKRVPANFLFELFRFDDCKQSDIYDEFENFVNERCQYVFVSDSTNTDILEISMYVTFTGVL